MNLHGNKFGVYDPNTKIFYTIPVSSQEEFNEFMQALGLVESPNEDNLASKEPACELFDDFDEIVEEVQKTPLGLSCQILMEFDF